MSLLVLRRDIGVGGWVGVVGREVGVWVDGLCTDGGGLGDDRRCMGGVALNGWGGLVNL